jgi:hypothetical protein
MCCEELFLHAEDWIQGLVHARQVYYLLATSAVLCCEDLLYKQGKILKPV